jgi:hypothetical protein
MVKFCLAVLLFSTLILSGCYTLKPQAPVERSLSDNLNTDNPYLKDFGLVKAGEVVRHSFVIQNNSQRVLKIKNVSTSCGCAVSEVKSKSLNPGESTFVDVKFNSEGYSGMVQQFVYVSTDSLDESLIKFIIKANVIN